MSLIEYLIVIFGVLTFPIWLPIIEIQNQNKCHHFDIDCSGSWAFHGDKDGVCPIEKDQAVFDEMKRLGGNMKLTIWQGDNHGVSGKFIPGAKNSITYTSSERCNSEPDFLTWLFAQSK